MSEEARCHRHIARRYQMPYGSRASLSESRVFVTRSLQNLHPYGGCSIHITVKLFETVAAEAVIESEHDSLHPIASMKKRDEIPRSHTAQFFIERQDYYIMYAGFIEPQYPLLQSTQSQRDTLRTDNRQRMRRECHDSGDKPTPRPLFDEVVHHRPVSKVYTVKRAYGSYAASGRV